jgi:hypothetical protein
LLENLYSDTGKVHPSPANPQVSSIAPPEIASSGHSRGAAENVSGPVSVQFCFLRAGLLVVICNWRKRP